MSYKWPVAVVELPTLDDEKCLFLENNTHTMEKVELANT